MSRLNFMTIEELMEMQENDDPFVLVEVLGEEDYSSWHLPDAINIPVDQIGDRAEDELDKDETVIVYCASYSCHASTKAARKLMDMDFEDVRDYKAGKKEWKEADLKVE